MIAVPVIVGILVIGISNEIFSGDLHDWLKGEKQDESSETNNNEDIEPDVKRLFDSLKERYQKRYESKLDGRFEITLEVSEDWDSDKLQTHKFDAEAKISDAVTAVRKAFSEKGRLLIVGSPGSGKTVLLLKLARELLGDDYKADQKLPVIFNLASWSPTYETFEDWLIDVLNSGNGLSKDFAKTVLREKRIIFLLDGLDELARNENTETAHEKRAKCLDSLNEYLREGRQAVICCRREDFAEMQKTTNTDAPVSAKVEVLDLTKADILLALQSAKQHNESRPSAEHLEEIIETNEVFLEVLSTPFYFTTALEVFDKQSLKEKDFPTDSDEVKKYLRDKFVESKISHTQNLTEFEKDTAKLKKWLKWLARLMQKKQLVTFELANLQPTDLIKRWYFGLFLGLFGGLFGGLVGGLVVGLVVGLVGGLVVGLVVGLFFGLEKLKKINTITNLQTPYQRVSGGFSANVLIAILSTAIIVFLILSLSYFMPEPYVSDFDLKGLVLGLFFIIIVPISRLIFTPLFLHSYLRLCLWFEGSMPLKYATFLDYAAEARILEKDGGQWRFRHQNLQKYFAKLAMSDE